MADLFNTLTGQDKRTTLQYVDPDGTTFELLKIDAVPSLNHSKRSKATQHEIEDGSFVSDHVIKSPRVLTLRGIISDTPINLAEAASGNIAGVVGSVVGGVPGAIATGVLSKIGSELLSKDDGKPSKNAMDMLDFVYENKIPLTIITGLQTYINMIMEDFDAPQNPRNAGSLNFTGTFKEVRIVESEEVLIPASATENESAIKTVTEGKKPPLSLDEATESKSSTALFKIFGD